MTDDELLERLRQYSKPGRGDDHPQAVACREAKNRIEQLTAERDRLRAVLSDIKTASVCSGSRHVAASALGEAAA